MKALYQDEQLFDLIPQRPPIVMLDAFYGIIDEISHTGLTVANENIFCENNFFQEAGIIEHIAQSAAARIGYIFTQKNKAVPIGFIGSVDKLTIHFLPSVGDKLNTQIELLQEFGEISMIAAEVRVEDKLVANCKMKIFLKS